VLWCDSSSLAFCLKAQEATLIDCANPAAVPLNPSQTISRHVVALKVPCILTSPPKLLVSNSMLSTTGAQVSWPWSAGTMPSIAYNIMLAGPRARREPHGQTQKLVPHSVSMLADLYEVAHGVDTAARFDLHSARESNLSMDNQLRRGARAGRHPTHLIQPGWAC
jgi:hypothetical protein